MRTIAILIACILAISARAADRSADPTACDGGDANVCINLGNIQNNSGNLTEAARFYKIACDKNNAIGCSNLGSIEEKTGNIVDARLHYAQGCESGNAVSCNNLAIIQSDQGNTKEARQLFQQACMSGYQAACNNLQKVGGSTTRPSSKADETDANGCIDTGSVYWAYDIVQKIDDHTYEIAAEEGREHRVLKTKRAVFKKTGRPLGLKVKNIKTQLLVKMKNGFSTKFGVTEECELIPLSTYGRAQYAAGSLRNSIEDYDDEKEAITKITKEQQAKKLASPADSQ